MGGLCPFVYRLSVTLKVMMIDFGSEGIRSVVRGRGNEKKDAKTSGEGPQKIDTELWRGLGLRMDGVSSGAAAEQGC